MSDSINEVKCQSVDLIRQGAQCETETVAGMGSMPSRDTVTDPGGDTTNTKEQVFLGRVLGIMDYAHQHLPPYPFIREQIEYWNEIVEAWEELTEKSFFIEEDEELGEEEVS